MARIGEIGLKAISVDQASVMLEPQFAALTSAQLGKLTPASFGAINAAYFTATNLNEAKIRAINGALMDEMADVQLATIPGTLIGFLSEEAMGAMRDIHGAAITGPQVTALTADQIGWMSPAAFCSIRHALITPLSFGALKVAAITPDQAVVMTIGQFLAIPDTAFAQLDDETFGSIPGAFFLRLTAPRARVISRPQARRMNRTQLAAIPFRPINLVLEIPLLSFNDIPAAEFPAAGYGAAARYLHVRAAAIDLYIDHNEPLRHTNTLGNFIPWFNVRWRVPGAGGAIFPYKLHVHLSTDLQTITHTAHKIRPVPASMDPMDFFLVPSLTRINARLIELRNALH